jgi:hypothetical protein
MSFGRTANIPMELIVFLKTEKRNASLTPMRATGGSQQQEITATRGLVASTK